MFVGLGELQNLPGQGSQPPPKDWIHPFRDEPAVQRLEADSRDLGAWAPSLCHWFLKGVYRSGLKGCIGLGFGGCVEPVHRRFGWNHHSAGKKRIYLGRGPSESVGRAGPLIFRTSWGEVTLHLSSPNARQDRASPCELPALVVAKFRRRIVAAWKPQRPQEAKTPPRESFLQSRISSMSQNLEPCYHPKLKPI